jgi:hypothetical protein
MRDERYRPFDIEELEDKPSLMNEAVAGDNVGVPVPAQQRSLHVMVVQSLKETEALINRLELGVAVADSGRALVRELYVQSRRQREVLAQALQLELG